MSAAAGESAERASSRAAAEEVRIPVYVWDLPVRLTHWAIALSLFVLAATGYYVGRPFVTVPGEAVDHFVTGTIRAVHFYAAVAFTVAVLARLLWMFTGTVYGRWHQFLPVDRYRRKEFWETFKFYTFLRVDEPGTVGHNAVAGAAYVGVYGLCLVEIGTGLALYGASAAVDSPLRVFAGLAPLFGGLQLARWIHHGVMWLLLGFFVHHLVSSLLMAHYERNGLVGSIFSGVKFVRREVLERVRAAQEGRR